MHHIISTFGTPCSTLRSSTFLVVVILSRISRHVDSHYLLHRSATEQLLLEVQDKANGQEILDLNDISGGVVTSIIGQLGLDNGIEMVRDLIL